MGGGLEERLQHVYWIGGGSCAGKSTIARRLAARHHLDLYATDDAMSDHARRSSPETCPLLHGFMAMDMDERWVNRSPQTMFETFHWFRGEAFDMIVEDVLQVSPDRRVIVEGFRLLPRLVRPLLSDTRRAVWLLPTPRFRQAVVEGRGGSEAGFLAKTTDPDRALHNLLERDRMFTDRLRQETEQMDLPVVDVDTGLTEENIVRLVTEMFGL